MTIVELLERAAAAGRQSTQPDDDLATFGHHPRLPVIRCQSCGRVLWWAPRELRWYHAPAMASAFDQAFDEVYRR